MNPWYAAYIALGSALFLSSFPFLWAYSRLNRRFSKGWKERLGFLPPQSAGLGGPIWLHASSMGEVRVAEAVMSHLRRLAPECAVILSVNTDYGFETAGAIGENVPVVYAPFDLLFSVRKSLSIVRPRVMAFLETEIWPAWIVETRRKGIPCVLINGRISARSIGRYRKAAPFFREVLKHLDVFSMITEEDGRRIVAMGADPDRVQVNGNGKHDLLALQADPSVVPEMRRLLNLAPSDTVIVAGSTREGEEAQVLDVYSRLREEFPGIILVIAPRHVGRRAEVESQLKQRGLSYQLRSRLLERGRQAPILILDTFGELFKVYSVGDINFCGASLVPMGGQNPLEPAAWGKAVFYGPFMDDFTNEKTLLEKGGGSVPVRDGADFFKQAVTLLKDRDRLAGLGVKARQAVLANRGAAERHARVIVEAMGRYAGRNTPLEPRRCPGA